MVFKKKMEEVKAFTAGDETRIREILHPKNDDVELGYSLAYATLQAGEQSLPHRLQTSSEVYILLSGKGRVTIDGEEASVTAGEMVFIPAGAEQYILNTGTEPLQFLCIVSPPWRKEDETIS